MILLTRLSGEPFFLNPFLVEVVEGGQEAVITLVTGKRLRVVERKEEVAERLRTFFLELGAPQAPLRSLVRPAEEGKDRP
ncbi:MAG: flagellar FlbD family protein [Brockia lithotrophica]|nr:flagellar FlbD family protein [Brockia lithotrophica]